MYPQTIDEWQRREDAREAREMRFEARLSHEDLSIGLAEEEEESEPECECIQIDVDEMDARYCPAHGPHSPDRPAGRQGEADGECAYWPTPGWEAVFGDAVPAGKPIESTTPA